MEELRERIAQLKSAASRALQRSSTAAARAQQAIWSGDAKTAERHFKIRDAYAHELERHEMAIRRLEIDLNVNLNRQEYARNIRMEREARRLEIDMNW